MDSRTAAHVLSQIAAFLELKGENSFKCRAYAGAAKGLLALGADDLAPLYHSGELGAVRGLGPATLAVVRAFPSAALLRQAAENRCFRMLRSENRRQSESRLCGIPSLFVSRSDT